MSPQSLPEYKPGNPNCTFWGKGDCTEACRAMALIAEGFNEGTLARNTEEAEVRKKRIEAQAKAAGCNQV